MQLTKKSSYGLIAILELAGTSQEAPISAAAIADRYSLSGSFVEKILHRLRQADLVVSHQGRSGGYTLARSPAKISLRQVLEALDESLDLVGCLRPGSHCDLTVICPTKGAWKRLDTRFKDMLESLSLEDLLET
ncbi:Rrf2 family transcriptional regulator [Candidatus Bipolaricaulota bacterium]|nr:Rrf2 family transcriptional regulator [Candidatus Bipolaricaulota bacterium]